MVIRSSAMQDYVLNKKIEELNPIPDNWTTDEKNHYLDSGYLPMAGETPADTYQTKKITMEELHHNLSKRPSTMVVTGMEALTEDGTFNVSLVRSAGDDISVTGSRIQINPGWYQYTVQVEIAYTGTALNRHERIYLDCNWHTQSNSCDFDFSVPHTETIELCGMIHNPGENEEDVTMSIRNLPKATTCQPSTFSTL